jgi:hypothetical protein
VVVPKCPTGCYEPSIVVDGAGRIVVVDGEGQHLAVSESDGRNFTDLGPVPLPPGAPSGLVGADSVVEVAPWGELFYVTPLTGPSAPLISMQVASSSTGGRSWDTNILVSLAGPGHNPVAGTDRPWLGFGQDGRTVYLSYNEVATGEWISRSNDRGATFGPFFPAGQQGGASIGATSAGPAVADSRGTVFLPFAGAIEPATLPADVAAQSVDLHLFVSSSSDGGQTFTPVDVAPAVEGFPVLTLGPSDALYLAHGDGTGAEVLQISTDHGMTWTKPVAFSQGKTTEGPWISTTADGLDAAYFVVTGSTFALYVTHLAINGTTVTVDHTEAVATGIASNRGNGIPLAGSSNTPQTDFPTIVSEPNGRMDSVWVDAGGPTVRFVGVPVG